MTAPTSPTLSEAASTPTDPRYPLGPLTALPGERRVGASLETFAQSMVQAAAGWRAAVQDLGDADLARRARPDSWTVLQLAHHSADAHLHGLNRLRHGLTEDHFQITPFDQTAWLTLPDAALPPTVALDLMDALNAHWVALLRGLDPALLGHHILHPREGEQDLWQLIHKHDWHLRHHLAQVRHILEEQP